MNAPAHTWNSLAEIRGEIDRIDRQIVSLIAQRAACVREAARFKKNEAEVAAPERVSAMLAQRRAWATDACVHPDLIESLYRTMVQHFIAEESQQFRSQQERAGKEPR